MDYEAVLNSLEQEEEAVAAVDHDQNFISSRPIPFAIRNWMFGTSLGVLLILIEVSYQDNKGAALILFDKVHPVNMELMISAFILFLWATVVERTISCLGGCGYYCLTVISWKHLFGHIADVLSTFIIGLLTSVLPSSVKVAKYITYIVCAVPTIRLFVIFLVIPFVEFILYKCCCFDNIDGDGNNGEGGVRNGGRVVGDIGGVGDVENGDNVGVGDDNSGAIQMSSLDSSTGIGFTEIDVLGFLLPMQLLAWSIALCCSFLARGHRMKRV